MAIKEQTALGTRRSIGTCGTVARVLGGGYMAGTVAVGSITGEDGFRVESWLIGLVVLPAVMLAAQMLWSRRHPGRVVALNGPTGHLVTLAAFLALYGTTWYAPPVDYLSDAALLFFGSSMLLAAIRGYAGCEVLSVSNWLLRRDDQVGCIVFDAIDRLEEKHVRLALVGDADEQKE